VSARQLLFRLSLFLSRIQAFFARQDLLFTARFALPHELSPLLSPTLDHPTSLLLGESRFDQVLRVVPTSKHRELGNLLVTSRTRGGKGLLANSQLLTWQHSVVVNDIKGELFARTR
jgi:type IV secretory pathway TraG/TraD family ATPase VirD4